MPNNSKPQTPSSKPVGVPWKEFDKQQRFDQASRDIGKALDQANSTIQDLKSKGYSVEIFLRADGAIDSILNDVLPEEGEPSVGT